MGLFDRFKNQKPADDASAPASKDASPSDEAAKPAAAGKGGWFASFRQGLRRTADVLNTDIRDLFKSEGRLVDDEFLRDLYAILVKTDMGAPAAGEIRDQIGADFRARRVQMEEILAEIGVKLRALLAQDESPVQMAPAGPTVIMVVGVNGSGKTTSIAKLAYRFKSQGKKVVLGAADTFRAAAVEQLTIWAERIGVNIAAAEQGSDPASVAFRAVKMAVDEGADVCIIDTAGRLQTQVNLMQELNKIRRVLSKQVPEAPHEVLLVLDATAGQNGISQARGFSEAAECTGLVLSKIDGTAKGGVVVPIRQQFGLPVKFVGVGEKAEDLALFNPDDFVAALLDQASSPAGK